MSDDQNILDGVEDMENRLDVLAYRVIERAIGQSENPMLRGAFSRFRNPLAEFLAGNLGPIPVARSLEERHGRKGTGSQRRTGKRRRPNPAKRRARR